MPFFMLFLSFLLEWHTNGSLTFFFFFLESMLLPVLMNDLVILHLSLCKRAYKLFVKFSVHIICVKHIYYCGTAT